MDGWRDPLQALEAYETWLARQPLSQRTRGADEQRRLLRATERARGVTGRWSC